MELALLKTGGGVDTSELTATENDVVSPYTFYGKDDEEKDTGGDEQRKENTHIGSEWYICGRGRIL